MGQSVISNHTVTHAMMLGNVWYGTHVVHNSAT